MAGGLLAFFFSSRRRHTRYIGDWSSDVCSSDLSPFALKFVANGGSSALFAAIRYLPSVVNAISSSRVRSEERRVGKEWRRRRGRAQERKQVAGEDVRAPPALQHGRPACPARGCE